MSAHTPGSTCNDCGNGLGRNSTVYLCPLHAAAPALLEALERMEWEFTRTAAPNGENLSIIAEARAAIALAKGDK